MITTSPFRLGCAAFFPAVFVMACGVAEPRANDSRAQGHAEAVRVAATDPVADPYAVRAPDKLDIIAPDQLRATVARAVEEMRSQDPATSVAVATMQPQRARTGGLTFTEPSIAEVAATPILAQRLLASGTSSAERVALAGALARSGGDFGPILVGLLDIEKDPAVRTELVSALRRVGEDDAYTGLVLASGDPDPKVRAGMAATAGRRADGRRVERQLVALLADTDASVRAQAARAIAALDLQSAFDAVATLLPDASADVRLHAMRALSRLDLARARELQAVRDLRHDDDARVRRAAAKIVGP